MADLPIVSALWIGGELSWLERLCLTSWVDAGHPTVLYVYEPVAGVPEGVEIRDGRTIVADPTFHRHERTGSFALFSDLFRFHLMAKAPAEIWIDTDIYCWRRLIPDDPHVFGFEAQNQINGAVLGLPPDSDALEQILAFTEEEYPIPDFVSPAMKDEYRAAAETGDPVHVAEMPWGIWGPHCLTHYLNRTGEAKFAAPVSVYYPIHFKYRNTFFKRPDRVLNGLSDDTVTLHFWGRIKRFSAKRFGGHPPEGSFLHWRMERHGMERTEWRITNHGHWSFDHADFDDEADEEAADDAVA